MITTLDHLDKGATTSNWNM